MTVPWQDPAMNVWWWRNQILLLTGLGAWALMSLIMVLSLRPVWLERPLGGMDKIYRLHKWAGIGAIVLSLLHYGTQLSKDLLITLVGRPVRAPRADWWLNTFRHLAEDMGEWAVWFLAAMLVITLWQRFPYHVWRYLHKLLPMRPASDSTSGKVNGFFLSQLRMAPAARDRCGAATMRLGSKNWMTPRPSHLGQAPIGLLKENRRGSSSCSA